MKIGMVVNAIKSGCRSVGEIIEHTGLIRREVEDVLAYLKATGELPKPEKRAHPPEEISKAGPQPEGPPDAQVEELEAAPFFFGHVIVSDDKPTKPGEFWITIDDPNAPVEIGSILAVKGDGMTIIGVVDDMISASRSSSISQFYQHQAERLQSVSPSIRLPVERYAHVRVLARDPPRKVPPSGQWLVRFVDEQDIDVLFRRIPENCRILAGFFRGLKPIPIYFHSEFLLGTQGAHVNITGKTGLATKTSYAVFLAYSVLSWAKRTGERVAVVMFNVKRRDLMMLHRQPSDMEEAKEHIRRWARKVGMEEYTKLMIELWEETLRAGVDPFDIETVYFTYSGDEYCDELYENVNFYTYGLMDLSRAEVIAAIYRPGETVPDTQRNMIYTYFQMLGRREVSFEDMKSHFSKYAAYRPSDDVKRRFRQEGVPVLERWRQDVADAIYRRLEGFLHRADKVIEKRHPHGDPIRFDRIEAGKINVVQLFMLDEAEKRVVVNALLRELLRGLQKPDKHINRVMVFVDELNVYAPKAESPIKEQIIDIVARGRDLYLSLFGAQQFASQIDPQVYGNCSTKVVGNTDFAEIGSRIYAFLGGFRDTAPYLEKGEMLVYHPLYASPVSVLFPVPLYKVMMEG